MHGNRRLVTEPSQSASIVTKSRRKTETKQIRQQRDRENLREGNASVSGARTRNDVFRSQARTNSLQSTSEFWWAPIKEFNFFGGRRLKSQSFLYAFRRCPKISESFAQNFRARCSIFSGASNGTYFSPSIDRVSAQDRVNEPRTRLTSH
jgi:hypothetical protein